MSGSGMIIKEGPITAEQAKEFAYQDEDETKTVWVTIEDEIIDTTRWGIVYKKIIYSPKTNAWFEFLYELGATEYQDSNDYFEYNDHKLVRVYPHQVTVTEFRKEPA